MNAIVQSKPKLPGFINLLLVIALGFLLAKLMWLILTPEREINTRVEVLNDVQNTQKAKINYGKLIASQHLFGEIKKTPVVIKETQPKPVENVIAPTRLNAKLHGIVAYNKSKEGFALISMSNGPQKVYGKGDKLSDGVIVQSILPGKVIIDNHGKSEELRLPVNKANANNALRKGRKTTSLSYGGGITSRTKPMRQQQKRKKTGSQPNKKSDFPGLAEYRQKVIASPQKLLEIARPSPVIVDGQFIGFRVQPGSQRKVFRNLGFKANDIITEVNGIILDDASKGAMVLGELTQAAELSIKVKRGDEELFIEHTF